MNNTNDEEMPTNTFVLTSQSLIKPIKFQDKHYNNYNIESLQNYSQ